MAADELDEFELVRLVMERLRAASGRFDARKLAVLLKSHADVDDDDDETDVGELLLDVKPPPLTTTLLVVALFVLL